MHERMAELDRRLDERDAEGPGGIPRGEVLSRIRSRDAVKLTGSASEASLTEQDLTSRRRAVYPLYILRVGVSMQTKIQKWGNSLGLRIPRSFAVEARVEEGATVDLSVKNGRLLVRPLRVRRYSLNRLLRKVSRRNLHGEVSTGEAVGREAW